MDVIVPVPTAFNQSRVARARRVQAGEDWGALFASPEDAIVKKMDFYRQGGSDKHLRDIASVLQTSGDQLDTDYIERWAAELDLADVWRRIVERLSR